MSVYDGAEYTSSPPPPDNMADNNNLQRQSMPTYHQTLMPCVPSVANVNSLPLHLTSSWMSQYNNEAKDSMTDRGKQTHQNEDLNGKFKYHSNHSLFLIQKLQMMIILERRGQLSLDTKLRSWNENSLIVIIFQDSEDMRLLSLLISLRDRSVGEKNHFLCQ